MTRIIILIILLPIYIGFISCEKEKDYPKVKTISAVPISGNECTASAEVLSRGSYKIIDHGFLYQPSNMFYGGWDNINVQKKSLGVNLESIFTSNFTYYNSGSENYLVRAFITDVNGTVYGNIISFQVPQPKVINVEPNKGQAGDTISIFCENMTTNPGSIWVDFNYTQASIISTGTDLIKVLVPDQIYDFYYNSDLISVNVRLDNYHFAFDNFQVLPSVTNFTPNHGTFGTSIGIHGNNYTYDKRNWVITLGDMVINSFTVNSNSIIFHVPYTVVPSKSKISVKYKEYSIKTFSEEFIMDSLTIQSISTSKVLRNDEITIQGENFYPSSYNNIGYVKVGNKTAQITSASSNQIRVIVPMDAELGSNDLYVSNGVLGKLIPSAIKVVMPIITDVSPKEAYCNTIIKVEGENFYTYNYPYFTSDNWSLWTQSYDSTTINAYVPHDIPEGDYQFTLTINGNSVAFPEIVKILDPVIEEFVPSSGSPGTVVEIKGKGFPTDTYYTKVLFGTTQTNIISATNELIKVQVPSNSEAGLMKISIKYSTKTIVSADDFQVKK